MYRGDPNQPWSGSVISITVRTVQKIGYPCIGDTHRVQNYGVAITKNDIIQHHKLRIISLLFQKENVDLAGSLACFKLLNNPELVIEKTQFSERAKSKLSDQFTKFEKSDPSLVDIEF